MVAFRAGFLLGLLLPVVSCAKQSAPERIVGAYIAELADDKDASTFYDSLSASSIPATPRLDLPYKLFKGVSFQLENVTEEEDTTVTRISNMSMVKQLWPVHVYNVPNDEILWTGDKATALAESLKKRQTNTTADTFSPHVMTQVDKLRAEGFTGAGIKIAVIDSGVDYTHPALGGCFGEGCLVSFGTDLVGDDYDGGNTPVPDPDPYDGCGGHGTHVSGIIAAQTNPYGFTGAAPGVTLGMYRVFGCTGGAGTDVLIAAYNLAYEAGADIITASIGGSSGWSEEPWSVAVQRIVEAGVPCTVSAGNDGSMGLMFSSTAANGKKVTAVASIDNSEAPSILSDATYTTDNTTTIPFGWSPGSPADFGNVSLPLWAVDYNVTDPANGCTPYPDDTPDLSGYIVLIRRGTCSFVQKATYAAAKGARYVMLYNNAAGASTVSLGSVDGISGIGMVTAAQGVEFINLLQSGVEVVLNIVDPAVAPQHLESPVNNVSGGYMSTFTSWGPTFEIDVKPQIATPGGIILSTFPLTLGGYAVASGTSMACPLAAAIFALVGQVRGTLDPATLENALSATSKPNVFFDGSKSYSFLAPVPQQGSGLVQAYDAAYSVTLLSVSSLSFNDTDHFVETANFTIQNTGSEEVTYELGNVAAVTAYTMDPDSIYPSVFPNEFVGSTADLEFAEAKVTIAAGGSATIAVSPIPPADLDASRVPIYSGYITINGTNGENLSLPYQGAVGSMNSLTVIDDSFTYLTTTADDSYLPTAANTTFVIPSPGSNATSNAAFPAILISLAMGSSNVRVDIVPQSDSSNATTILGVQSLGNIDGYPSLFNPRLSWGSAWGGELEDGTYAPAGTYTMLVRALKIFGDVDDPESYQSLETVPFTIEYV